MVPADAALAELTQLLVDESSLTGESFPVAKQLGEGEAATVWAGTTVLSGRATAEVTATGGATRYGRIGSLVAAARPPRTPLQLALARLVRALAVVAAVFCAGVVLAELVRGDGLGEAVIAGVSLAIAAIPEEFSMIYTLYLSLGAWRLAQQRALVRRLPSVETLGSTTVICTDKTGTLTQNRLALAGVWVSGSGRDADHGGASLREAELLEAAVLACELPDVRPARGRHRRPCSATRHRCGRPEPRLTAARLALRPSRQVPHPRVATGRARRAGTSRRQGGSGGHPGPHRALAGASPRGVGGERRSHRRRDARPGRRRRSGSCGAHGPLHRRGGAPPARAARVQRPGSRGSRRRAGRMPRRGDQGRDGHRRPPRHGARHRRGTGPAPSQQRHRPDRDRRRPRRRRRLPARRAGRDGERVRTGPPGAQAPPGRRPAQAGRGRGHDRRRDQRRSRPARRRHRRGDGSARHGGGSRVRVAGPARRQLRHHRERRARRTPDLRQPHPRLRLPHRVPPAAAARRPRHPPAGQAAAPVARAPGGPRASCCTRSCRSCSRPSRPTPT